MNRPEWIDVTPAIAERWLETKAANRNLNENLAIEYGLAMERGGWQQTHQGIAFNDKGQLVDGQHRLFAITLAKKTVKLLVVRGLTKDEVLAIDTGRVRTSADSLTIYRGTTVSKHVVAIANRVIHISPYYAAKAGKTPGSKWHVATADLDRFLKAHPAAMLTATSLSHRTHTFGISSAMTGSLLFRAYYHLPEKRMTQLIDVLATGHYDDEVKDSAALLLRTHLLQRTDGWRGTNIVDHYRMERAVKAFARGERIARIYPTTEEVFPIPEEAGVAPNVPATLKRLEASRSAKGAQGNEAKGAPARSAAALKSWETRRANEL